MYPAQEIEIHGVKVDRKKLREIITLPDLSALTETLQFIGNIIPEIGNFFNFFQIDEEREKVRRLNDRIESQADNHKVYAVTNGEIDVFAWQTWVLQSNTKFGIAAWKFRVCDL